MEGAFLHPYVLILVPGGSRLLLGEAPRIHRHYRTPLRSMLPVLKGQVHEDIAWGKFRSMVEGAKIASKPSGEVVLIRATCLSKEYPGTFSVIGVFLCFFPRFPCLHAFSAHKFDEIAKTDPLYSIDATLTP